MESLMRRLRLTVLCRTEDFRIMNCLRAAEFELLTPTCQVEDVILRGLYILAMIIYTYSMVLMLLSFVHTTCSSIHPSKPPEVVVFVGCVIAITES